MLKKRSLALLVSLLLVLSLAVGGTLAFLTDTTKPMVNTFTPSEITTTVVEDLNGNTKSNVQIKNTGDTTAFIRAFYVITWQNEAGDIYGEIPKEGTDYSIERGEGWLLGNDGFYYWPAPVKSEEEDAEACLTGVLIKEVSSEENSEQPEGYNLHVEIIASAIQHKPADAFAAWAPHSGITYGETALTK